MRAYATPRTAAPRVPALAAGHCWPVPPQETLKHSKTGLAQSLLGLLCAQGFVWALRASLASMGFDSKYDFAPSTVLLGFLLCLGCGVSFFFWWESNILLLMVVQQWVVISEFLQEKIPGLLFVFPLASKLCKPLRIWLHPFLSASSPQSSENRGGNETEWDLVGLFRYKSFLCPPSYLQEKDFNLLNLPWVPFSSGWFYDMKAWCGSFTFSLMLKNETPKTFSRKARIDTTLTPCKEIQPVHSEGDQPWDFFGRNDAKAETPVRWPPHAKSWLIGKDSCWEGLGAGGEGDDRGWDVWMATPTRWTWVWVNFGSWWWTGRCGVLQFMG